MTSNLQPMPTGTTLEFITVDVFTRQRYHGNPLAVVLVPTALSGKISQEVKQRIAREFNLSETVFLHVPDISTASGSVASSCRADIFTTETELPFAGHPSIGTAYLVLNHLRWDISALQLKAGIFPITRLPQIDGQLGESDPVQIKIAHDLHVHSRTLADVLRDQPALPTTPSSQSPHAAIAASLSLDESIREAELQAPLVSIVKGMTALLVKLPSLEHLSRVSTASRLRFDESIQDLILDKGPWGSSFCYRYYYVPMEKDDGGKGDNRADTRYLRARMVELASEDPATGSAAVTLGAYLAMQEHADQESVKFEITQGVEMGRQSEIAVEVKMSSGAKVEEIYLGGSAVIVMNGAVNI
ncbi:diaminopimelate epimerase [Fusarium sporotrichioides]|uniref:Diaminopimelate epimerase n=1 Tax=Fusarium sporotrichioides TaxID=5514 RepID=A0A395SU29_FUSSP|nr:diaminopimelate epimerase [Fusarium sporotrichioides]